MNVEAVSGQTMVKLTGDCQKSGPRPFSIFRVTGCFPELVERPMGSIPSGNSHPGDFHGRHFFTSPRILRWGLLCDSPGFCGDLCHLQL